MFLFLDHQHWQVFLLHLTNLRKENTRDFCQYDGTAMSSQQFHARANEDLLFLDGTELRRCICQPSDT